MEKRSLLAHLAVLALGIGAGMALSEAAFQRHLMRHLDERLTAHEHGLRELAARPAWVAPAAVAGADHSADFRRLREELAALRAGGSPPAPAANLEVARPPSAAEQHQASVAAEEVFDGALANGRWSDDDETRFERALLAAEPARRQELAADLSQAINSGRLHLATAGR